MRAALAALVALVMLPAFLVLGGCASASTAPPSAPTAGPASLEIAVREVEYRAGDTVLRGHLALPASGGAPRPAVLVVHEWWGRGAHSDQSAEELARLGYVGLALDMYGDGRTTSDPEQAGAWSKTIKDHPDLRFARLRAAMDVLRSLPEVDMTRVACIGYCFGGTTSLEAAWAGLDLRAVVSFHGSLTTPAAAHAAGVKASILVCHGADDPFVPKDSIDAFQASMRANAYDWEFAAYGGAVHSFTNPAADGSFNPGAKYHAVAAARSWALMQDFLAERLR